MITLFIVIWNREIFFPSQINLKLPWGSSVVLFLFMVFIEQLYHSVETPSIAKYFVPVIWLYRAETRMQ